MQKVIADLTKNARETMRVELSEYKGHQLASLRLWVTKAETGDLIPTAKGCTFNVTLLPAIIAALSDAERGARAAGLLI